VWLVPGPSFRALAIAAGTVGLSSLGLAFGPEAFAWSAVNGALPIGLAVASGAAFAVGIARQMQQPKAPSGAREVSMAIVPWGVLVDPGDEPRILRWPAVRKVDVDVVHTLRGGTPAVVSSVVTVQTERDVLVGHAAGSVGLESLTVNLQAYADEAARPLATDLDGLAPIGEGELVPVASLLLRHAQDLCSTSQGAARLCLPSGDYRRASLRVPGPETVAVLARVLSGEVPGDADPRPLAALCAALLGAKGLVPALVRLVNAPHPIVAAVARAAALRLGVMPSKVGSIEEVGEFLFEEDREIITAIAQKSA